MPSVAIMLTNVSTSFLNVLDSASPPLELETLMTLTVQPSALPKDLGRITKGERGKLRRELDDYNPHGTTHTVQGLDETFICVVILFHLRDFLLHYVGGSVERDDHYVTAGTSLDVHLGAEQMERSIKFAVFTASYSCVFRG